MIRDKKSLVATTFSVQQIEMTLHAEGFLLPPPSYFLKVFHPTIFAAVLIFSTMNNLNFFMTQPMPSNQN